MPLTDAAFRVLIEHAADLIVVVDPAGVIRYVSPSAGRLGYPTDWAGRPVADIVHPDDRAALAGAADPVECRLPLADGSWRTVEAVATDLRADPAVGGLMIDFRDVTARKQAEDQLRSLNAELERRVADRTAEVVAAHREMAERNSRHKAIFEGTSHLVTIKDLAGRYTLVNPAAARLVGRDVADILGKTAADFFDPMSAAVIAANDRRAMDELTVRAVEESIAVDGVTRHFVATRGPYYDADGKLAGVFGISRDVTDRKEAEDAARAAAETLRSVTASIPGVVYRMRINIPTRTVIHDFVSDGVRDLAGLPPEEALGDASEFVKLIHPEDLPGMEAAVLAAIESGIPADVEYRLRQRGGSVKWVRGKLRLTDQRADGWLVFDGFALDMTAQKEAERQVRENDAKFRALFDGTSAGVVLIDAATTTILDVNAAFLAKLGVGRDQVVGQQTLRFAPPVQPDGEDSVAMRDRVKPEVLAGTGHRRELVVRRPDGTEFPAEFVLNPFHLDGRQVVLAVITDVTDRKRTEEALRRAAQAAEAANRAKSEFLAHMSHEIRTPMNGILGLTELALESGPPPDQREYLELVKGSAEALLAILNDLLDVSKIEAGKLDLERAPFALRRLVDDAVRPFAVQARGKGLRLDVRVDESVPDVLVGDAHRLRQIVLNLVGNAVKFTDRGGVDVRVESAPADGRVGLRVAVADTGVGIPADKQKAIFQAFEQADGSTTRRYGGTGLGLTIAARLAEMMGGQIGVQSAPGQGSTFFVTARFDRGEAVPAAPPAPPAPTGRPLRVLLAEDHEVNQLLARRLLERRGHQVTVADDGRKALDALARGGFDLALLDVQMPELDGLTVVTRLREREKAAGRPRLPVLALTAFGMKGDRERCLAAGMDGYLSKPIRAADLFAAVDRYAIGPEPVAETVLSPASIRAACGGDDGLLRDLVEVYRGRAPALLANVREAVAKGDTAALERAAHACKGVVATFSEPAAAAARRLEHMGRSGDLGGSDRVCDELAALLDRLDVELAAMTRPDPA